MPGRSGRVWQEDGHQQPVGKSRTETQRNAHPRKQDAGGPSKAGWLRKMSFLSPLHEIGNAEYCSFKPQPSCRPCLVGDSLGASTIRLGQAGSRATECSDGYTGRVLTGNKPLSRVCPIEAPASPGKLPWWLSLAQHREVSAKPGAHTRTTDTGR